MNKVSKTNDNIEICSAIKDLLKEFTDSDYAEILIYDEQRQALVDKIAEIDISMIDTDGILGDVFLKLESNFYNHLASEKRFVQSIDNPHKWRLRGQLLYPMINDNQLLGIVRMSRSIKIGKPYSKREMRLVESLEQFLVKIFKLLKSNKISDYDLDTDEINENIRDAAQETKPIDADAVMMFLSNTVHDIRTPTNNLYGFLQLLEENIHDSRLKGFIENAKESAKFISTLADSILEHSKETHNTNNSKPSEVNGVKFFANVANIFSSDMYSKDIKYTIKIDPFLPKKIKINELKLKRVIVNLIGNAYKFTPNGKGIAFDVSYDRETSTIAISVADEGIGIDPSRQEKIFQAFEQAEEDTSHFFGGTGLGLSISAKYVNEMGGHLELESAIDKGSKFYFSIPIEVTNSAPCLEKFQNVNKVISILTNDADNYSAMAIKQYLHMLGMPLHKISISPTVPDDVTHIICFQHKYSPELPQDAKEKKIEFLLIEEALFSASDLPEIDSSSVVSKYEYWGNKIHDFAYSQKRKKVLIVDDNNINIVLLRTMLETEFLDLYDASNGTRAINELIYASQSGHPYDILFIDKHMHSISGTEVVRQFRAYEKINNLKPIKAVSITGDPRVTDEEREIFDTFIKKPFNSALVRSAVSG